MGGLERHRQGVDEGIGAPRHLAHHHELPEAQVPHVHPGEVAACHHAGADVDGVLDAVGLAFFEVVGEIPLGLVLLLVQERGDGLVDEPEAFLKFPAAAVDGPGLGVEAVPVGGDFLLHLGGEGLQLLEHGLDHLLDKIGLGGFVPGVEAGIKARDVLVDAVAEGGQDGQGPVLIGQLENLFDGLEVVDEVVFDGVVPVIAGGPDVGDPEQGVDIFKKDGLEARHVLSFVLDVVQGGLLEAPLHRGVDGGALFLDDGLDALVELLQAAVQGHGKERQHLGQVGGIEGV